MSRPVQEVRTELARFATTFSSGAIEALAANLDDLEHPLDVSAVLTFPRNSALLALTESSVICVVRQGSFFPRFFVHKIWWSDILTVEASPKENQMAIRIVPLGSNSHEIWATILGGRDRFSAVLGALQKRVADNKSPRIDVPGDLVGQLQRLAQLHGDGAITDSEFEQAKKKLLG